ncbi:MAG: hypothetical protein FWC45_02290 [Treponema sp.]|nr:hypothetical protein [Treponema sp.]
MESSEKFPIKAETPLSDLRRRYLEGHFSKKDFEGRVFRFLLDNHERYRSFEGNRDRWDDFLSWFYPRLVRALDLYRDLGSSFDAYITRVVHCASREYRSREVDHHITEYACWRARAEELVLCESESEYLEHPGDAAVSDDINPRQILLLLLKSYYFVSYEYVNRVAAAIGIKAEVIHVMLDELRKRRSEKETEIVKFRERVYCQHYRCLAYEKRMLAAQPGTEYHQRMKDRYERAIQRFFTMKKRLMGMRVDASNRMIAEVLGIPKGTVDSSLSAVKSRLAAIKAASFRD